MTGEPLRGAQTRQKSSSKATSRSFGPREQNWDSGESARMIPGCGWGVDDGSSTSCRGRGAGRVRVQDPDSIPRGAERPKVYTFWPKMSS